MGRGLFMSRDLATAVLSRSRKLPAHEDGRRDLETATKTEGKTAANGKGLGLSKDGRSELDRGLEKAREFSKQ